MNKPNLPQVDSDRLEYFALLGLILLLFTGLYFLRGGQGVPPPPSGLQQTEQASLNKRVTAHLQLTDRQVELGAKAREVENYYLAPSLRKNSNENRRTLRKDGEALMPLGFESEDWASRVYRDTEARSQAPDSAVLPDDHINATLENRRWLYDYDREQKEQYIRAFIDNANADGLDLQIDQDLQVKARPARSRSKPLRLPLSVDSGRPNTAK